MNHEFCKNVSPKIIWGLVGISIPSTSFCESGRRQRAIYNILCAFCRETYEGNHYIYNYPTIWLVKYVTKISNYKLLHRMPSFLRYDIIWKILKCCRPPILLILIFALLQITIKLNLIKQT